MHDTNHFMSHSIYIALMLKDLVHHMHVYLHPSFSVVDHVTVFVAYNGKWEYDRKEWFFKNSKSSIMVVPKHITLSEITDILYKQLKVDKKLYRLKLEVHYRTGSPWFPVTEIQNNQDLSVFISVTSKTKLPLCVTQLYDEFANVVQDTISSGVDEERRKGSF